MTSAPYLVMPANGSANSLAISNNIALNHLTVRTQTPSLPIVAHKHAHHLHSIPPKKKSTKSLILDHLLWLHALARIAHVGAEQGISVIRDDGDEENDRSNTSLCDALSYGTGAGKPGLRVLKTRVDFVRARALKARAEGLERVLTAMIDGQKDNGPLPDSVRFRLTLGALINDLFAPQPSIPSRSLNPNDPTDPARPQRASNSIPEALLPLSKPGTGIPVPSERFSTLLPSFSALTSSRAPTSPQGIFNSHAWSQPLGIGSSSSSQNDSTTSPRAKELYTLGMDEQASSSSQNQPPARCYRHLRHECESCTSPLASTTRIGAGLSRSSDGRPFRRISPANAQAPDADLKSRILEIVPQFLALSALVCTEIAREEERRRKRPQDADDDDDDPMRSSESLASSFTSSGTPHQSSSEYQRSSASLSHHLRPDNTPSEEPKQSRKLTLPFPFSRSSSTANDTRPTLSPITKPVAKTSEPVVRPTREWYALLAGLLTRGLLEGYLLRGWKGTNAVEVVLNVGHTDEPVHKSKRLRKPSAKALFPRKGPEELSAPPTQPQQENTQLSHNPDDLPNLLEASAVLFSRSLASHKDNKSGSLAGIDTNFDELLEEYSKDMEKRLSEFLNVPTQTRDLATHLEALSERYPAEPVEAGILRFCEAIAVWRGKPELEEYKRSDAGTQFSSRSGPYTNQTRDMGHSRSPSIQSNTSMLHQSPEKPRQIPLPTVNHNLPPGPSIEGPAPRTSSSPAPSMSIASLIHPPSSRSGYDSAASSSSYLPLPKPSKLLIDYFFALEEDSALPSSQSTDIILPPVSAVLEQQQDHPAKGRNPLDRWTRFTLGSKRPRDPVRDVILEGERAGKKALFVNSGKFNT